jgi:hypothetical protein
LKAWQQPRRDKKLLRRRMSTPHLVLTQSNHLQSYTWQSNYRYAPTTAVVFSFRPPGAREVAIVMFSGTPPAVSKRWPIKRFPNLSFHLAGKNLVEAADAARPAHESNYIRMNEFFDQVLHSFII